MTVYLTNSPGIFTTSDALVAEYFDLSRMPDDFCRIVRQDIDTGLAVSAIGHPAVAEMFSSLCGVDVKPNRIAVDFKPGDVSCGMTLTFRPEPGQEFTAEDMRKFLREGKVKLYCIYFEPETESAMKRLGLND